MRDDPCLRCTLPDCDDGSPVCALRLHKQAAQRRWYAVHAERMREKSRRYAANNPEKRAASNRRYYVANRDRLLADRAAR